MTKAVIFARVSTGAQEYDRQLNELSALAESNGWSVEAVFAEKISGAKANTERTVLMNMINFVEAKHINKVLVTELSRLGRDTLQVLEVIETLNSKGISLYIQNSLLSGEILPQRKLPMTITLRNIISEVGLIKYIFDVASFEEDLSNRI